MMQLHTIDGKIYLDANGKNCQPDRCQCNCCCTPLHKVRMKGVLTGWRILEGIFPGWWTPFRAYLETTEWGVDQGSLPQTLFTTGVDAAFGYDSVTVKLIAQTVDNLNNACEPGFADGRTFEITRELTAGGTSVTEENQGVNARLVSSVYDGECLTCLILSSATSGPSGFDAAEYRPIWGSGSICYPAGDTSAAARAASCAAIVTPANPLECVCADAMAQLTDLELLQDSDPSTEFTGWCLYTDAGGNGSQSVYLQPFGITDVGPPVVYQYAQLDWTLSEVTYCEDPADFV